MMQTMSVAGVQLWGWTLRQVPLAWDWWHLLHQSWELIIHPWHLREKTIRVVPVRAVTRLDEKAVRTGDETE